METTQDMKQIFLINNWYPLRISIDIGGQIRLTKSKTGWVHKGFSFQEGQALYPTQFQVLEISKQQQGYFSLKGKLRDNDHQDYLLSIEKDKKKHNHSRCSHSKIGDFVVLDLQENINYGLNQSLHQGQIKVIGSSTMFNMIPTKDKKCLQQNQTDKKIYIFLGHKPIKEQIYQIFNKN